MSPAVARAVAALKAFSPADSSTAAALLSSWAGRDDLTDAEKAEVIEYFADRRPLKS